MFLLVKLKLETIISIKLEKGNINSVKYSHQLYYTHIQEKEKCNIVYFESSLFTEALYQFSLGLSYFL
jgi:hypothetical protein